MSTWWEDDTYLYARGGGGETGNGTFLSLAQEKQTGSHLLTQFFL